MFGTASPPTRPHATSATVGAPASVSAISSPVASRVEQRGGEQHAALADAVDQPALRGAPTAAPIANAPSTRPATAYEPRASAR